MNAFAPIADRPRRLLDVEDYLCLNYANPVVYARTELIEGEILLMNSQYRPHAYAKSEIAFALRVALAASTSRLAVLVEASVAMPPNDVPMPDVVLTSEPRGKGLIPLSSVALLVEIADTSLGFDLRTKAALYARHGVPEYWVVDLDQRRIVGHSKPIEGRYSIVSATSFGDDITAATIPGLTITTIGLD